MRETLTVLGRFADSKASNMTRTSQGSYAAAMVHPNRRYSGGGAADPLAEKSPSNPPPRRDSWRREREIRLEAKQRRRRVEQQALESRAREEEARKQTLEQRKGDKQEYVMYLRQQFEKNERKRQQQQEQEQERQRREQERQQQLHSEQLKFEFYQQPAPEAAPEPQPDWQHEQHMAWGEEDLGDQDLEQELQGELIEADSLEEEDARRLLSKLRQQPRSDSSSNSSSVTPPSQKPHNDQHWAHAQMPCQHQFQPTTAAPLSYIQEHHSQESEPELQQEQEQNLWDQTLVHKPSQLFDSLDLSFTNKQRLGMFDLDQEPNHPRHDRFPGGTGGSGDGGMVVQSARAAPVSVANTPMSVRSNYSNGSYQHRAKRGGGGYAAKINTPASQQSSVPRKPVAVKRAAHPSRWGKQVETSQERQKRLLREKKKAYAEERRAKVLDEAAIRRQEEEQVGYSIHSIHARARVHLKPKCRPLCFHPFDHFGLISSRAQ